ncbi:hypothetical protein HDU98_009565 [Podochytrium sp. JEL0797]|nr:hypothetical protein HDU98_009565 [Podochytrium sp. JEL0797]
MSSASQIPTDTTGDLNGGQIIAIVAITAFALVVSFGMCLCYCCWRHKRITREKQDEWKRSEAARAEAGMVLAVQQQQQLQPVVNYVSTSNPVQQASEFHVSSSPRITFEQQQDALRVAKSEKKSDKSKYGSAPSLYQHQGLPAYN